MAPRDSDDSLETIVARIDERTENMDKRMDSFVTQIEFWPVKNMAYGLAALIFVYFIGKILALT